jgi:hypothetical protein
MLDLFRVSSRLLTVGDRLAAGLGLTSARWQISAPLHPPNVRNRLRGLLATSAPVVKRVADRQRPAQRGLIAFEVNPHHRRLNSSR